jgi:creatinine amidohydrolase/Fe(II)-dependent formamide hydrolase-like protein
MEGHAGEWETSLALHSFPELVDGEIAQSLQPNVSYDLDAFRAESVNYQILSNGTGYFGSPGVATTETGRRLLAIRGRNMADIILKAFTPKEKGK